MSAPEPHILPDLNSGPRNFITTSQDHGGVALVICTLMATWAVLCFIVRMYMRTTVSGPIGWDDWVCAASTVFGVIQMITSAIAISFGFGKATDLLTPDQIDKASKAVYVAQLLYIITNALTKCSVSLLLARLVFIKSRRQVCYAVLIASILWGVGSFMAEAIRCTDHPGWKTIGRQCSNLLLAWQVISSLDILIEVVLLAVPVWLVWGLQTSFQKKFTVVAVFWLRIPVIVACGLRLRFLANTIGSSQPLLRGVIPFTLLNIQMHYALMSSTMPTLKPFVGAFNTRWGTYDTQGISGYGGGSNNSYALASIERSGGRHGPKMHTPRSNGTHGSQNRERDASSGMAGYGKNVTHVRSARDVARSPSGGSSDSQRMIIHQTLTCEVHYEGDPERGASSQGQDSVDYSHPKLQ